MNSRFKSGLFKFIYWLMIIILAGDTIDTIYRFIIIGYLGEGANFPGVDAFIKPTTTDLIVFIIFQIGIIYGIYLLYKLKKIGGYWVIGSNIILIIYAAILGPIAEVGFSTILPMVVLYFGLYIILAICIPIYYSDKFE